MILRVRLFLLADLCVDQSCLGQRFDVCVGGNAASLCTPSVEMREGFAFIPGWDGPSPYQGLATSPNHPPVNPDEWGRVFAASSDLLSCQASLSSLMLEMDVDDSAISFSASSIQYQAEGPLIADVQQHAHEWLERLRDWTGAIADQHTGDPRLRHGAEIRNRVWVWPKDGESNCRSNAILSVAVRSHGIEVLNRRDLAYVLARASEGSAPPLERMFLAAARNSLRQLQLRHAVLDAATSVELVLAQVLLGELSGVNEQLRRSILKQPTLSRTIEWLRHLSLPVGLKPDLADVRNRVIHSGSSVSLEEASKAVAVAGEIVDRFTALSPLL